MKFKDISSFKSYCGKFKNQKDDFIKIKICITGCRAAGSLEIFDRFKEKIGEDKNIKLIATGCHKVCSGGPVVKVDFDGR